MLTKKVYDEYKYEVPLGKYQPEMHTEEHYFDGFSRRVRPLLLTGDQEDVHVAYKIYQT